MGLATGKSMPTQQESVTTYIPADVKEKLMKWAKEEDRSVSYLVAKLIVKAVEEREKGQSPKSD